MWRLFFRVLGRRDAAETETVAEKDRFFPLTKINTYPTEKHVRTSCLSRHDLVLRNHANLCGSATCATILAKSQCLPKLLDLSCVKAPKEIDAKILVIDAHYIKARYMEDRFNSKIYNRKNARVLLTHTEEVMAWLQQHLG